MPNIHSNAVVLILNQNRKDMWSLSFSNNMFSYYRELFCCWVRVDASTEDIALHNYILSSFWYVCDCVVD